MLRMMRWYKTIWIIAGILALALGVLGVILPGLPTTPFVLLAATCFAKGSPTLHQWLLAHRFCGPMIRDWEQNRSLPLRIKGLAIGLMLLMTSLSIWHFAGQLTLQLGLAVLALIGAFVVLRIPTRSAS
ncbi:MAG: YbaN family protein [Deefgea sp.]